MLVKVGQAGAAGSVGKDNDAATLPRSAIVYETSVQPVCALTTVSGG